MRPYEVMVIFDASLDEDAIGTVVGRVTDVIAASGGTTHRVDHWGRRRLAYEIEHRSDGYYVLIEATAEPGMVAELDRVLSLADEVMRHKVIRIPEAVAARARKEGVAAEAPQRVGGGRG